jgi:hypothetical protein
MIAVMCSISDVNSALMTFLIDLLSNAATQIPQLIALLVRIGMLRQHNDHYRHHMIYTV